MSRGERGLACLAGAVASFALGVAFAGSGTTYAAYSDHDALTSHVGAGVWASEPAIPAACGPLKKYKGIITGTDGPDTINAGNGKHVVFGLGGGDTIDGGNGKDCLVGGPGDDVLLGGNGKDTMIGGAGIDTCTGGRAPDVFECEIGDDTASTPADGLSADSESSGPGMTLVLPSSPEQSNEAKTPGADPSTPTTSAAAPDPAPEPAPPADPPADDSADEAPTAPSTSAPPG